MSVATRPKLWIPKRVLATPSALELITHRFTKTSKGVLDGWYPASALEMDEAARTLKRTKFGATKFVYPREVMRELEAFFRERLAGRARVLYFT